MPAALFAVRNRRRRGIAFDCHRTYIRWNACHNSTLSTYPTLLPSSSRRGHRNALEHISSSARPSAAPTPHSPGARHSKPGIMTSLPPSIATRLANETLHDRIVGTLLGSALGDAIGLYTEFLTSSRAHDEYPTGSFTLLPKPTPFARDFHRLKHRPGEWTDDTDHALLILLSFLHTSSTSQPSQPQPEPQDVAKRLHVWVEQGLRTLDTLPLGLGRTVGTIVRDPAYLSNPLAVAHQHWAKAGHTIAPNGSLMRTHPLGLTALLEEEDVAMDTAARISCVTHVDPRCVVACMIGTAMVRGLVRGEVMCEADVDGVIDRAVTRYNDVLRPEWVRDGPFTADEPPLDLAEVSRVSYRSGERAHASSTSTPAPARSRSWSWMGKAQAAASDSCTRLSGLASCSCVWQCAASRRQSRLTAPSRSRRRPQLRMRFLWRARRRRSQQKPPSSSHSSPN